MSSPEQDTITFSGTIVTYVVPVTGTYDITAYGAQGGSNTSSSSSGSGGAGAEIGIDITLTAGTTLDVLVGGKGASVAGGNGAGGGGGSFVVEQGNGSDVPLVVAGGGGGGELRATGDNGQTAIGTGAGGTSADGASGGGGGGYDQNGGGDISGGSSFVAGGAGGTGFFNVGNGGFGGGGGGGFGAGGGGGYSGGNAGTQGGSGAGGLSYYSPAAISVTFGVTAVNSGNGEVMIDLVCFLAGTRIATPGGEVLVEELGVGDVVLTADGRTAPLTWIGRRSVDAATPLDRDLHYPVRICRDAVAPAVPYRDLLVTGDHAVFVDGHLIPARMLVNGASIRAERAMTDFTYFHIELAQHDLLLAEGLPAESYLDTGNRHMFAPGNVVGRARLDRASAAEAYLKHGVAPLALDEALVKPVWRRLAERAARLGVAPTMTSASAGQPDLHLLAQGRRILPSCADGGRVMFVLAPGTREVQLACATARPSETRPWLDDRRRLGVMVSRILLQAGSDVTEIALDGPQIGSGWHGMEWAGERAARWTGGDARILLPPSAEASLLELTIPGEMRCAWPEQQAA